MSSSKCKATATKAGRRASSGDTLIALIWGRLDQLKCRFNISIRSRRWLFPATPTNTDPNRSIHRFTGILHIRLLIAGVVAEQNKAIESITITHFVGEWLNVFAAKVTGPEDPFIYPAVFSIHRIQLMGN